MHTHCLHGSRQTQVGAEPPPCKRQGAPVVQRQGEPQHRAVRQPFPGTAASVETAGRTPVGSCLRTSPHPHKAPLPLLWANRSKSGCSVPGASR